MSSKKKAVVAGTELTLSADQIILGVNYGRGGVTPDDAVFKAGVAAKEESIKEFGQITPLLVREVDGAYHLVDGFERFHALVNLGLPIKVRVDSSIKNEKQAKVAAIISNFGDTPTATQQAEVVQLLTEEGYNLTQCAAALGYNNTNRVSQLQKLLGCKAEIRQAVHTGALSLYAAVQVADSEEAQDKILKKLEAGEKVGAVEAAESKSSGGGEETEGESEPKEKGQPRRNASHLTKFLAENEENLSELAAGAVEAILTYLSGAKGEKALLNALKKIK